ncbi:recombinase family protein [uncultured Desulfovibrio sp.]|uniref:recombinase family protein n=1 Tax=uncultured Desulfovibrio sp. TaxID=167968 RepID=UPI002607E566|nr:recombinase family protein [uncultured Desulfovibrio sp.]
MHGKHIGYIRVSSIDQNTARQLDGIMLDKIFTDTCSGKDTHRPGLVACLDYLREGDVLHIHSIDRLARNLQDLLHLIESLNARAVAVVFHKEGLTFSGKEDPFQKLQLQIIGAVAQFERALLRERQREGIAIAKAEGKYKGRKPALTSEQVKEARQMVAAGQCKQDVARYFGISRTTLYKAIQSRLDIDGRSN